MKTYVVSSQGSKHTLTEYDNGRYVRSEVYEGDTQTLLRAVFKCKLAGIEITMR